MRRLAGARGTAPRRRHQGAVLIRRHQAAPWLHLAGLDSDEVVPTVAAWRPASAAGLVGPSIVGILRDNRIAAGGPRDQVYDQAMYVLAALLALGFAANLLVRPVARRWFVSDAAVRTGRSGVAFDSGFGIGAGGVSVKVLLAWTVIGLPLAWGVFKTIATALKLFG